MRAEVRRLNVSFFDRRSPLNYGLAYRFGIKWRLYFGTRICIMPVFGTRLTTSIWIGPTSLKLNRQPPDAGELCEHSLRIDDFYFQLACTQVKREKEEGNSIPMLICMTYTSCNWLCMEARLGGYCCCALPSMRQQSNPVSGTQLCVDFTSTCAVCSAIALLVCLAVCSFDHERCGFRFMEPRHGREGIILQQCQTSRSHNLSSDQKVVFPGFNYQSVSSVLNQDS